MIPEEKVAEIRERIDLAALIGEHVELKRSGTSLRGLCPFHGEKTPSFYVHPDRGFFHCFGCQASGDAITFLMRIEGCSFPEAARQLAERAGLEIEAEDSEQERASRRRKVEAERLYAILEAAAGYYISQLHESRTAASAQAELAARQVGEDAVTRFRLGYAPDGWDGLATFLAARSVSPAEAERVGLLVPRTRGEGYYDRFRHRLMFPISDPHGRIVAFSGRALAPLAPLPPDREPPAKYVNSPETPLYTKGNLLFGLHEARVELRRRDVALVCEGNFDVVALSQAGFGNVVAPLGTAFTVDQAKLLRRYASTAVLLFDSDAAGRKAVRAAHPLLAQVGIAGKVVALPPGDDPDSFLRAKGKEAMAARIDAAPPIVQWLIETTAQEAGADPRDKAEAIESLGPVLAVLDNPVEARLYVERVARVFEVSDVAAVRQQLRRGAMAARPRRGAAPPETPAPPPAPVAPRGQPLPELEARLVGAILDHPRLHDSEAAQKVQELLTSADLRAIFSATARWVGARGVDAAALLEQVEDSSPARDWLVRRLAVQEFEDEASAARFVERCVDTLAIKNAQREDKRLNQEIRAARAAGDDALAEALMRRKTELFQGARRFGAQGTKR